MLRLGLCADRTQESECSSTKNVNLQALTTENSGDILLSAAELIERAQSLAPLLAQHAAQAEKDRKPADSVIEALRKARIFDLMVPKVHGGLEFDLDTFLEVGLALAEGDASMAWVATFYIEHNWMLCQFPAAFQNELYRDRSHVLAPASLATTGKIESSKDGYRLNGRWQWATGWPHAEWVIAGAMLRQSDSPPQPLFLALPRSEVEFEDTWWTDGMRATGSQDIIIRDRFVPAERSVVILAMASGNGPGAELHQGALYRTPMSPILGLAASMPAVGQARAGLRRFQEEVRTRKTYGGGATQSTRASIQARLGKLTLLIDESEELLRRVTDEVMALRNQAGPEERTRWLASTARAVHKSREALTEIAAAGGASAHFESHPLQRAVRDVNTLSAHTVFDLDQRLEDYGRTLLGMSPTGLF